MTEHTGNEGKDMVWVVVHGKRSTIDGEGNAQPFYLGQFGWTPHRRSALQFPAKVEADLWVRDAKRNTPLQFVSALPEARRVEKPTTGAGSLQTEYEPFEGLNA